MKKATSVIICAILCLSICLTLCSCGDTVPAQEESTTSLAQAMGMTDFSVLLPFDEESDDFCAVFYLGGNDAQIAANKTAIFKKYFTNIDAETVESIKTFSTIGGDECYFIVPRYSGTTDLNVLELDDSGDTNTAGLLAQDLRKPFFLNCNASDLFPDIEISVKSDTDHLTFSPRISLESGRLLTVDRVLDLTEYEIVNQEFTEEQSQAPTAEESNTALALVSAHIYNKTDDPTYAYDGSPEYFWSVICAAVSADKDKYYVDGVLSVPGSDIQKYAKSLFFDGEMQPIVGSVMDTVTYDMDSDTYNFSKLFESEQLKTELIDFKYVDSNYRCDVELTDSTTQPSVITKWCALMNKTDGGFGYVIADVYVAE